MINIPAFKAHLRAHVMPGEGVLVLSEDLVSVLYGAAYEKVAALIDGTRSVDAIVDALAGQVDAARVYYAIEQMVRKGHLAESANGIAPEVAAFWHAAGVDPVLAVTALKEKTVAILAVGQADVSALHAALVQMNISQSSLADADLLLVATDDYLAPALAAINDECLTLNRPWLLLRMTGPEMWLGPLFEPQAHKGCWACLRQRLERNRAGHRFVAKKQGGGELPITAFGALAATRAVAGSYWSSAGRRRPRRRRPWGSRGWR